MNFSQAFKMGMKSIMSSKLRTFLTMLGIIIGVCAVIILVSVVQGSTGSITDQISSLGANSISVMLTGNNKAKTVEYEELLEFAEENPDYIQYVVPNMSLSGVTVKYMNTNSSVSVTGTTPEYITIKDREISEGRFINSSDIRDRRKVAIIGSYNAQDLFGFESPIDKQIKLNGQIYTIVGVFEEKADSEEASDDDLVVIPYTAGRLLFNTSKISSYTVWATTPESSEQAADMLENFLFKKLGDEDGYRVFAVSSMLDAIDEITGTMTLLTAGIAGISLLVGGIGIMNIMLVSVTERTREIGIRKAIGARRFNILSQFLIESVVVSCMGGLVGIVLGIAGSVTIGMLMGVNAFPQVSVMLAAFLFSAMVGIFFGWAPANKASKLNPIDALHAD